MLQLHITLCWVTFELLWQWIWVEVYITCKFKLEICHLWKSFQPVTFFVRNIPVIVPWRVESWPRCINLYTVVDCVLYCCAPLFVFGIYTFRRSEKCLSVWVFCWVWNTSECDVWWYLQGICYHIADSVFLFALFYCFACWSGVPVRSWVSKLLKLFFSTFWHFHPLSLDSELISAFSATGVVFWSLLACVSVDGGSHT